MDLRQMRYFTTVVQQKNFSKAAQLLHVSQPSLSNAISKLEKEVGFPLLERNTRSLHLTDSGKIMYERALELLNKFDHLTKEMKEVKQTGSGHLSLGLIESAKHWMPKVIHHFKGDFPNIKIQLLELLGVEQVQQSLLNYETHAAITNQMVTHRDLLAYPIYNERLVLLVHFQNELSQRPTITMKDLEREPFIISTSGFQTRKDILHAFDKEQASPNIMYEIERFETACSLVEEGLGVTIIPENYIKYSTFPSIRPRYIQSEALQRTVYLAHSKNRYLPPFIHSFLNHTTNFLKSENS
ncbi:LysR family transcriptional regulator [Bacillus aerolatus]|uniref:LysR family transcriptional regulator n=1 Tax=Bacillus aerolatus TaxID=2653354 RepID=A0A6I1FQJ7_9BACI|nr:LysR family transcriptional regulator [Bacillus aerolatus]KAB7706640.1 LysR family transcriptional regulator [Bacillus aerolatus]